MWTHLKRELKQQLMKSHSQIVFCVPKLRNVGHIYIKKICIFLNWLRNICNIRLKTVMKMLMKRAVPLIMKIIYMIIWHYDAQRLPKKPILQKLMYPDGRDRNI